MEDITIFVLFVDVILVLFFVFFIVNKTRDILYWKRICKTNSSPFRIEKLSDAKQFAFYGSCFFVFSLLVSIPSKGAVPLVFISVLFAPYFFIKILK